MRLLALPLSSPSAASVGVARATIDAIFSTTIHDYDRGVGVSVRKTDPSANCVSDRSLILAISNFYDHSALPLVLSSITTDHS